MAVNGQKVSSVQSLASTDTNNHKPKVLLIAPDDRYLKSANVSSFGDILQCDSDFKNKSLPYFDILEWKNDTIKSGSFEINDYILLAKQISNKYLDYDGFVILDSISTIPYTASYLSFMMENLAKPIVLTGSHSDSMNQIFSDAKPNVLHSLIIAAYTNICEVVVCFNKKLFRGNRTERNNINHDPFITYNYPQLGEFAAMDLHLTNHCMRHTVKKRFKTFTKLFSNIVVIHLIPLLTENTLKILLFSQLTKKKKIKRLSNGKSSFFSLPITPKTLTPKLKPKVNKNQLKTASKSCPTCHAFNFDLSFQKHASVSDNESDNKHLNENKMDDNDLPFIKSKSMSGLTRVKSIRKRETFYLNNSSLKGVIISFFGVGNAPSRQSFKNILKQAVDEYNCEIVVTCQSKVGSVDSSIYASGNFWSDLNLISAVDMTIECCVAKLSYLLGKGYRNKQLKEQFETNLRGELTEINEHKRRVVQHIPMGTLHSIDSNGIINTDSDDDISEEMIEQEIFNQKNKNQSVVDSLI